MKILESKIAEAAKTIEALRQEKRLLEVRFGNLRRELSNRQSELEAIRRESDEFSPLLDDLLGQLDALGGEAAEEQQRTPPARPKADAKPAAEAQPVEARTPTSQRDAHRPVIDAGGATDDAQTTQAAEGRDGVREASGDVEPHAEHFQRGVELENDGKYEEAIEAYRQALKTSPEFVDAIEHLAFLLEKLNREDEAAPFLEKVLALKKPV